ncbi:cAMP-dependent protein kinase inhibitor alpha [Grus japonensis]|uniref:cAMP-dependent protein kinase inhibitor alpha n=1 Tax=Grus japonensis TaxID=30415 RepID=A0ABC9VVC1_GRUJA
MVGFLGCKHTMPAHLQFFIHQLPQVLLCRGALNPFIPQSVLVPGIALTKVQDLALVLVELHEVHVSPLLKLIKVLLDGIPPLKRINCTTHLVSSANLLRVHSNPTISIIDEDVE